MECHKFFKHGNQSKLTCQLSWQDMLLAKGNEGFTQEYVQKWLIVDIFGTAVWSSLQTRAWWTGVHEKKEGKGERERARERESEREREHSISRVTWKINKAHTQDLYLSWRHRASSQGGLESPGEKVSSAGFHAPTRMKTERTWATPVSSGARVFY